METLSQATEKPRARRKTRIETAPSYRPESSTVHAKSGQKITSARDVYDSCQDLHTALQEHFVVYDLDARNRVIARRVVSIGTISGVEVHPREVFRGAILNGASSILMVHNHPSGSPDPSQQDLVLTQRLRDVGSLMGIQVLDHVIVAAASFVSLAERGWK